MGFGVLGLGFLDGLFGGKPKSASEPIALFIPSIIVINRFVIGSICRVINTSKVERTDKKESGRIRQCLPRPYHQQTIHLHQNRTKQ